MFYLTDTDGWTQVGKSYEDYKEALLVEPINISFAVGTDFMYYASGIYTGAECSSYLNHAM